MCAKPYKEGNFCGARSDSSVSRASLRWLLLLQTPWSRGDLWFCPHTTWVSGDLSVVIACPGSRIEYVRSTDAAGLDAALSGVGRYGRVRDE